jgi:hypothetical protein
LASIIKLPALFLLTLVVTFPSLYVFSAIIGVRLTLRQTIDLIIASLTVSLAVAASLGPILVFFTLSTDSYHFMVLLNVVLLAAAGFVGLGFLRRTLGRISEVEVADGREGNNSGVAAFSVWVVIYGVVGLQMAWILRPFIGHPSARFEMFRPRSGNFLSGLFENLGKLVGG